MCRMLAGLEPGTTISAQYPGSGCECSQKGLCAQNEGEIAACNYHAGMTPKQRIQVQNQWRSGVLQVVVATIAFGMGESTSVIHFLLACPEEHLCPSWR